MNISADAMMANIILSKKLLFITPYLGFGVTKTNFTLKMAGNYPLLGNPIMVDKYIGSVKYSVPEVDATNKPYVEIKDMTDPINITSSELMPNVTFGLRLKVMWILTVHAQYTMQKYPTASVGFGLAIR
jgi:hypothetical protein